MSDVCRSFGISRKTGYKVFNRYKDDGLEALTDRSRRPVRHANQLPDQIERMIVTARKDKPHWGARKIRELLVRRLAGDVRIPSQSTVHAVLDRHGLVKRARQRRRFKAEGAPLSSAPAPNDLWCADFKGEFKLGNGQYCYPLTVIDQASRMILLCEALASTREQPVIEVFARLIFETRPADGDQKRQWASVRLRNVLAGFAAPAHVDDICAAFDGRNTARRSSRVAQVLDTLVATGLARPAAAGGRARYFVPR